MDIKHNYFEMELFVNQAYAALGENEIIDHAKVSKLFEQFIANKDDEELIGTLTYSGFIPDIYGADSTEETLYTKLCEVIVSTWANRMGFSSTYVSQKASFEDVDIIIDNKTIVCDTKSFRLGRSQAAPNVKDFVKPEDYRKWLNRYNEDSRAGGLVVYPSKHEWKSYSDTYQYCSDKTNPIVMLPYHYLAFFLYVKNNYPAFDAKSFLSLWDYKNMFPSALPSQMDGGNKKAYWEIMNKKIIEITGVEEATFTDFLNNTEIVILEYIDNTTKELESIKKNVIEKIKKEINSLPPSEIKEELTDYRIQNETKDIDTTIKRIRDFRINKK